MTYEEVKQAVAELGLHASKERVRARLGGGSYQDLWPLIVQARAELSGAPLATAEEAYSWPEPDPQRVRALRAERTGERAVEDVIAFAEGALAQLELMSQAIPQAQAWALTHDWALPQYFPGRETRDDLMRGLQRFLTEAGARFEQIRATQEDHSYGPTAA